jgi:replicative DNA helicase
VSDRIEEVILENLLTNDEYARKTVPFIDETYFQDKIDKTVFSCIKQFYDQYNAAPTKAALKLAIDDSKSLRQQEYELANTLVDKLGQSDKNTQWLYDATENFCKDKAVYNAIMTSIGILDGGNTKYDKGAIPSILSEALAISFDKTIGHDYFEESARRYDYYHLKEDRVAFDLELFNKITKGGIPKKTLNIVLAGTNVGKSLFLCHHAASVLKQGKNALYITMEMAEERIAERIDCNLLDITVNDLYKTGKKEFTSKFEDLKAKTQGKLVVKEYPTSSASVQHFKSLLDELKLKKNFVPDIIYVDYINICCSARLKGDSNSYFLIKAIAEELRGMAVEYDVPVFSATQTTRGGFDNTDVSLTDTSESFGLPATADFMFAMMRTEELDKMGQLIVKQLKSRYNDVNYYKRFVIGIDIQKFKLYDVEQSAQDDIVDKGKTDDDIPLFDKSKFGNKQRGDFQQLDFT